MTEVTAKTAREVAAEERARINVTTPASEKDTAKAGEKETPDKETPEPDKTAKKDGDEGTEVVDEVKEEENEEENSDENKEEEKAPDPAKLQKTIERMQRRIDSLTAKTKLTETEKNELTTKLATVTEAKGEVLTADDVEKQAKIIAEQTIAQRDFVDACNRLAGKAEKIDKTFVDKCNAMAADIGQIPSVMIGILDDLPLGPAIFNYLTDNVDEAQKIYALSPAKMAIELTKIEVKVKPKPKPLSKVPDPIEPIKGTARTSIVLKDDEPMADWVAKRNQQVAERQEMKRKGMR